MISEKDYKILNKIDSPKDLKALPESEIPALCEEIRSFLVEKVSSNGGHLASNLGVVELSVALHRVFDTPKDHIIFDVGHQSYVHKLLTGRKGDFDLLRVPGGLSGFPKRDESEHDAFGTGHSSTSVSAALGFATADKLLGKDSYSVAILGDGAFTGGMIHEALNNCRKDLHLIIVLNENEMSISKNTGKFATSIAKLRAKKGYFKVKKGTRTFFQSIPLVGDALFRGARDTKKALKNVLYGSNYFEDMDIYYLGPVDGNDHESVEALLREAKELGECTVVHIKTTKGKGFSPAENDPALYHGVFPKGKSKPALTYSELFGKEVSELAKKDKKICAITAAMSDGTGLEIFKKEHPDRFFDVGIAEPHAVTFAAGLAADGLSPVFAVYSTFLQRAYDNVLHDVALQNLPVLFGIDRAGLNPADGATHHGIFDVAFLSQTPNVRLYTPASFSALRRAVREAAESGECCAIRYPSGAEIPSIVNEFYADDGCDAPCGIRTSGLDGCDAVVITHGRIAAEAIKARDVLAAEGIKVGIILAEFIKPYDKLASMIFDVLPEKEMKIVLLEEEVRAGGFGMMLKDKLSALPVCANKTFSILATDDHFCIPKQGQTCYEASGVDCRSIVRAIKEN